LALKCLRPAVRAEPRKFIIGAEDLAHETAILACLDHPNIIQLHGRAEGCFSTAFQMRDKDGGDDDDDNYDGRGSVSNNGKKKKQISNEGYFIILDRLMDTLTDRIEQWKDECLAIVNMASTPLPYPPQSPPYFSTDHDAIESTLRECLRERLKVVYSIADAFEYLHSRNVVFRDLKPANVGFDQNDCVKVFDFGFATSIAPLLSRPYNGYGPLTETCGTRRYMAPEVALKLGYGKEVDVYSFGMLLWEVCALDKPFDTIQSVEEFHDIVVLYGKRPSLHVEPYWPTSLKALMSRCWSTDPLDRPTMVDVKSMLHNVLRDVSGDRNGGCNGAKFSGFGGHRVPQQGQDQVGNFMSKWRRRVSL
jgi:serine/threonine protein kinase